MNSFRKLLLTGFLLMTMGFVTLFLASLPSSGTNVGGAFVIFIGPFPLAFGFGEYSPILILISVIIAAVMIMITLTIFKRAKQTDNS
ncbi:MAG: hypothetical protein FGF48_05390 [Candidatus Brockarchaeota archaeon]|nr:hypothetical protein [Candidatus Brockarchaeota archaeon]